MPDNGKRRLNAGRAAGSSRGRARLFDQQNAPIPPKNRGAKEQEIHIPLAALGMEPLDPPKKSRRKNRPAGPARRRQLTRSQLRRRSRRRRWAAAAFLLAVLAAGAVLSFTVLFKVEHIVLENLDKTTPADTGIYTEQAVLGALAVPLGEKLFGFSAAEKQQAIQRQLPYLETVQVLRRLPDTVVVRIAPAREAWCVKTDGGYTILSEGLRVLKTEPEQPGALPLVTGLGLAAPTPGLPMAAAAAEQDGQLEALSGALAAEGIAGQVTRVDMGRGTNAYFVYDGRVKVVLGTFNDLDYKVSVAALLLKNETGEYIAAADRGTLDVSSQLDDTARRFTFAPGEFTQEESEPPPGSADSASGSAASGSDPASDAASGPASASHPASDPAPASGSGEE